MPRSPPLASSDKLNANAQPFVPPEVKDVPEENPWQRQADMLTTRKPVVITDLEGNPVDLTPPLSAATPPSIPTPVQQPTPVQIPRHRTPIMTSATPPMGYKTPPSMYTRSPASGPLSGISGMPMLKAKCPSGHPLKLTVGSQMVCRDTSLVICGSVFCRRCDIEELDKHPTGYYTCGACNWDCCLMCASLPYTPVMSRQDVPPGVPPMPPLPASLKPPQPYPGEVLQSIHGMLVQLQVEAPCGLSTMPTNRLMEYENYLQTRMRKPEELEQEQGMGQGKTYQEYQEYQEEHKKVNVMKAEEYKERKRERTHRQLAHSVKDRVMFVGGGRFPGNKKWKDGAKLTVGEIGIVKEIDLSEKFPLKCQFENVYVMLTEDDLEEAPPEPVKAKKEKKDKKVKEKKVSRDSTTPAVKEDSPVQAKLEATRTPTPTPPPKVDAPKPTVTPPPTRQVPVEKHVEPQQSSLVPLIATSVVVAIGLGLWLRKRK